jgi:hypothetical protein
VLADALNKIANDGVGSSVASCWRLRGARLTKPGSATREVQHVVAIRRRRHWHDKPTVLGMAIR